MESQGCPHECSAVSMYVCTLPKQHRYCDWKEMDGTMKGYFRMLQFYLQPRVYQIGMKFHYVCPLNDFQYSIVMKLDVQRLLHWKTVTISNFPYV